MLLTVDIYCYTCGSSCCYNYVQLPGQAIIIIKIEAAVQGRERVRTLYHSEDPNPTQPTHLNK